ncbi:MAG: hypothetical protein IPK20_22000 [Betaproteobacteria bacterium]|nr:hypothetical protein [Betaproteobacteria bacterium]
MSAWRPASQPIGGTCSRTTPPRYYSTTRWPLDPHSFAAGALTFLRLRRFDDDAVGVFAGRILARGVAGCGTSGAAGSVSEARRACAGIIHMRWSGAWMLLAICAYLAASRAEIAPSARWWSTVDSGGLPH